jgi:predicted permease
MGTLLQDIRYGLRSLLKNPGFTAVAVATLALGIGANTAIFSYINSLFLRPLSVAQPEQLVRIYATGEGGRFDVMSYPNFQDLQRQVGAFAAASVNQSVDVSLGTDDTPVIVVGELVSGTYFAMLQVRPALGRLLTPEDDVIEGGHPQVVISDGLWKRRFGGSPDAVGRTIRLNSHPFTIVGVAPEGFRGSYEAFPADFWAPVAMHEQVRPRGLSYTRRGWGWLHATARLKPGVSLAQANAEVEAVAARFRSDKFIDAGESFRLVPAQAMPEESGDMAAKGLGAFLLVVGLVLLVACANIASVVLTRVTARRREVSIRRSLGATRGRLVQQWLVESCLLALLGGVAGAITAIWLRDSMFLLVPRDFGGFAPTAPLDLRVMGFALALSLVTGLLFGVIPAMRASNIEPTAFLKEGASAGGQRRSRLFGTFVAGQVAVSMVLLVTAGLLLQSLRNSESFDPGFATHRLALGFVDFRQLGYTPEQSRESLEQIASRLRESPTVESATYAIVVPLGNSRESQGFAIPGHTPPADRGYFSIATNVVGSDYFSTMRIPLLAGRGFDARDAKAGAPPVIVINETMARRFWPNRNPVGETIQMLGTPPVPLQIIGVARDIKYYTLGEPPMPYLYGSASQLPLTSAELHVRMRASAGSDANLIRRAVADVAPGLVVAEAMSFEELRHGPLFPQRVLAGVTGLFGVLVMLLTALGVYGIVSYTVNLRTRELGVRMALGAGPQEIYRMVIGRELAVIAIGVALGMVAAVAVARGLSQLLFGIAAFDPLTYAGVGVMLLGVGAVACWIPARRAARVDPVVALRYE